MPYKNFQRLEGLTILLLIGGLDDFSKRLFTVPSILTGRKERKGERCFGPNYSLRSLRDTRVPLRWKLVFYILHCSIWTGFSDWPSGFLMTGLRQWAHCSSATESASAHLVLPESLDSAMNLQQSSLWSWAKPALDSTPEVVLWLGRVLWVCISALLNLSGNDVVSGSWGEPEDDIISALSKEGTLVPWVKGDALACGGWGKILLRAKFFFISLDSDWVLRGGV